MNAHQLSSLILLGVLGFGFLLAGAATAGTVEIENISYTVEDPDDVVPTKAQVIVRATAMYAGALDANDRTWIIGCFLNDSIGGDLNDRSNPDFFDPQETDGIDGPDDRISCPGAEALIPRCENGGNVQFLGWTRASIFHFGSTHEVAASDLEVRETNCGPAPARVGGTVSGLDSGDGVQLRNYIRDNGSLVSAPRWEIDFPTTTFTFPDFIPIGHTYEVVVSAVSPNLNCSVANGTGTMTGEEIDNVQVTCSCNQSISSDFVNGVVANTAGAGGCQQTHPIGGQISGLDPGEFLTLSNTLDPPGTPPPSTEMLTVINGGSSFQFPTPGAVDATYNVDVVAIAGSKTCTVSGGSGTVAGPVNNIQVSCQCPGSDPGCSGAITIPDDFGPFIQIPPGNGICDPFWDICSVSLVPWWWGGPGPPTGPEPCQRVTVCEVCGQSTFVTADGETILTEELCCVDQCVESSSSTIVLNGPATLVSTPAENATVSGIINVLGQATDADGVAGFLFFVDYNPVQLNSYTFNGTQFNGTLDTGTLGEGVRELQVLSVDDNGQFPMGTIYRRTIVVDNVGGGGAPEIDVFLNWNNTPIPDGGSYFIGETTPPNVTISRHFRIENNGNATLTIGNPGSLVDDPCFSQRAPIAGSIVAGGTQHFWVDFNCAPDDLYQALVTINSNDADEAPYTFTINGTVSTPSANAPQITQQPVSQSVPSGSSVTFSVAATGSGSLTYQWSHNGIRVSNGALYSGATSPSLAISGADLTAVGGYRCEVSNAGGTTASSTANLGLVGGSCIASSTVLCLQGDIFEAQLTWLDPNTGLQHSGKSKPYSEESGFFYYVDPDNLEIGVKVLEGDTSWWVYHGGSTTVQYTLALTNTETGEVKNYFKPAGSTCGAADSSAFDLMGNSPAQLWVPEWSAKSAGDCSPGPYQTCLLDDRFKAEVRRNGVPQPMVDFTPSSSVFWFFGPENAEGMVKMVDATVPPFNQFWVFFGSLTHLGFEVVVTDTVTGQVNTYSSLGPHCGDADTSAFPP